MSGECPECGSNTRLKRKDGSVECDDCGYVLMTSAPSVPSQDEMLKFHGACAKLVGLGYKYDSTQWVLRAPVEPFKRKKRRVFIDMDGVIVDFDFYKRQHGLTGEQVKEKVGAYLEMPAIPGAIEAVRSVIGMGYEVWLATKPPTGIAHAYSDKAAWVMKYLPELKRRIIITHDKGLLGAPDDFLLDDRPHKANCEAFPGTLLRFVDGYHWLEALFELRLNCAKEKNDEERPDKYCVTMPDGYCESDDPRCMHNKYGTGEGNNNG